MANKINRLSRSFINQLAGDGKITVNNKLSKPSHKLKIGDKINDDFDLATLDKVAKLKLPIIYEDEDCVVINKPEGILTHSKGVFNPEPTVASFIKLKLKGLTGERAGIVHRLDRRNSGAIKKSFLNCRARKPSQKCSMRAESIGCKEFPKPKNRAEFTLLRLRSRFCPSPKKLR